MYPWNCGLLHIGGALAFRPLQVIRRYNTSQIVKGLLRIGLGAVAFWLAFIFFRFAAEIFFERFGVKGYSPAQVAAVCTVLMGASGLWQWVKGGERSTFTDSVLYDMNWLAHDLDPFRRSIASQVPGLSYALAQVFIAGPLQVLKGVAMLCSLLPVSGDLEARMLRLLEEMRAVSGWQDARKYADHGEELGALIRCGAIEFSATKGRVKAG
jgi:hypothetical protein